MKYLMLYRCRLCGCGFYKSDHDGIPIVAESQLPPKIIIDIKAYHSCDDGGFGISDFLGYEELANG